uniref:Uncharacterized protein n=1 Tax=Arundo donax TaxID=35708 RepID=A0A0A9D5R7_ARUDO
MQGWHSQRLLGNGEIADPIIKDKGPLVIKKDKTPKNSGSAKRKRTPTLDDDRVVPYKSDKLQNDSMVTDMGPPADWVKINVRRTVSIYISFLSLVKPYSSMLLGMLLLFPHS